MDLGMLLLVASNLYLVAAFRVRGAMEGPSGMPQGKHTKAQSRRRS
jgi:hypothetical protein